MSLGKTQIIIALKSIKDMRHANNGTNKITQTPSSHERKNSNWFIKQGCDILFTISMSS